MLCQINIIDLILNTLCFIKEYYYKYNYVIQKIQHVDCRDAILFCNGNN
jgi:hypothetical protein